MTCDLRSGRRGGERERPGKPALDRGNGSAEVMREYWMRKFKKAWLKAREVAGSRVHHLGVYTLWSLPCVQCGVEATAAKPQVGHRSAGVC